MALKVPNWVYGSFVPLGVAFILIRSVLAIVRALRADGKEEEK